MVALVITMLPNALVFAANGPNKNDSSIEVYDSVKDEFKSIYHSWDNEWDKVSGLSYDKKANCLTIKNLKNDNLELNLNQMGDNFSIKVSGTNSIKSINCEGNVHGGSIAIKGSGTLTINKKRQAENAIRIFGKVIKANLKVESGVILNLYRGSVEWGRSVSIEAKNANAISIEGISKSAYVNESNWDVCESIDAMLEQKVYECTFEGVADKYYAYTEEGWDGYEIYEKTETTISDFSVLRCIDNRPKDDESLVVDTGKAVSALLENRRNYFDLATKGGQQYAIGQNWEQNVCEIFKVTEKDGMYFCEFIEEAPMNEFGDPAGYEWQIYGQNNCTQLVNDLAMIASASISKITSAKNGVAVSWKAVSGASGYEVRYSTSSKMTNSWSQDLASSKKSVKITNLQSKIKVYVQVRAYKTDSLGNKMYSGWSAIKNAKTK